MFDGFKNKPIPSIVVLKLSFLRKALFDLKASIVE
jgi:hypothetical protein